MTKDSAPYIHQEPHYDRAYTKFLSKIYILSDSNTREEKFIGATSLPLRQEYERLRAEMFAIRKSKVGAWWHAMFAEAGDRPFMHQIDQIIPSQARECVLEHIERKRSNGHELEIVEFADDGPLNFLSVDKKKNDEEVLQGILLRAGDRGKTMRELTRTAMSKKTPAELRALLDLLVSEEKIRFDRIPTAGRSREAYFHLNFKTR